MRWNLGRLALGVLAVAAVVVIVASRSKEGDPSGVFAVRQGMSKEHVQQVAGTPYRAGPNCWLYRASRPGTSIVGMRFCFTNGRVSLLQTSRHA
jgi:hypothetical protein